MKKLLIALVVLCPALASAQPVIEKTAFTVQWDAPKACSDGTTDLTKCPVEGYRVTIGALVSATVTGTSHVVAAGLPVGKYTISVAAFNAGGTSQPATLAIDVVAKSVAPGAPSGIKVVPGTVTVRVNSDGTLTVTQDQPVIELLYR